ncbi:hypothetical protein Tco_1134058, partial [Tanacetum coccineum]
KVRAMMVTFTVNRGMILLIIMESLVVANWPGWRMASGSGMARGHCRVVAPTGAIHTPSRGLGDYKNVGGCFAYVVPDKTNIEVRRKGEIVMKLPYDAWSEKLALEEASTKWRMDGMDGMDEVYYDEMLQMEQPTPLQG